MAVLLQVVQKRVRRRILKRRGKANLVSTYCITFLGCLRESRKHSCMHARHPEDAQNLPGIFRASSPPPIIVLRAIHIFWKNKQLERGWLFSLGYLQLGQLASILLVLVLYSIALPPACCAFAWVERSFTTSAPAA